MTKFIFVTGGVLSSLGKGVASASIGTLLKSRGISVSMLKFDPYINVDPGTMSPFQHGEVFVTQDGAETDLDLGHYERFVGIDLSSHNNVTTGQIYSAVIEKERKGEYLGKTIQVVPHITGEIQEKIRKVAEKDKVDVVITEVGGTVGDIESLPFLEAIRQFRLEQGRENTLFIHLTLLPYISSSAELKTKPTQHSVGRLREIGIQPDLILCRTQIPLTTEARTKISLFCNVEEKGVIQAIDVDNVYEVPLRFEKEGLTDKILQKLNLAGSKMDLKEWSRWVEKVNHPRREVTIGVLGKYVKMKDTYKSINEALVHAGAANEARVNTVWLEAEEVKGQPESYFASMHGILVPGGFGMRGTEGKIEAIQYARERGTPFLGICLGMQCAVIEFARNVADLRDANSSEFDPDTPHPVIDLMPEQKKMKAKGGTMRLGAYACGIAQGSLSHRAYGENEVYERHRHRYEFNNKYRDLFTRMGLVITGTFKEKDLVEIIEISGHPWFVATQFHPEFKSRPSSPHPLFRDFIKAAMKRASKTLTRP
ncbi:CTP synthase [Candidatus Aerophobetes bacterium]|uniref:CTP synthase n=1 Tax=Aerophobetes bacterium TaxID=2030807 RepID=A0A523VWH5_UNCAE|nr:MAG: CTP synthase [Candidatus Aerophobetes bacterium]